MFHGVYLELPFQLSFKTEQKMQMKVEARTKSTKTIPTPCGLQYLLILVQLETAGARGAESAA